MRMILALAAAILWSGGCAASGLGARGAMAAATPCAADAVATRHSVVIGGRAMRYTACAGTLPVRNATGEVRGRIFYTAYLADARPGDVRPLSFVWNGGPGADSRLLHFHALGPRIIQGGKLADNPVSPLGVSDLIFVDPVGTGFSRAAQPSFAADFYGTVGDQAATMAFVRTFRTTYRRDAAPLYLIGEGFGTWRAAGVAEALIDLKVPVAGIALISGGIPLGDMPDRALMRALSLTNRTATALALQRLSPDLQRDRAATMAAAKTWARTTYYPALKAPGALSDVARDAVVRDLARYQGLDPAGIDRATLWVSPRQFRTTLLGKDHPLDIFDMRKPQQAGDSAAEDRLVIDYYRRVLGYLGGSYAGIDTDPLPVGEGWRYDQAPITPESLARARAGEGPPSPSQPWTLHAMEKAPHLRVWVAAGLYDSLNNCAGNAATVAALPPAIAARFSLHCYAGGHMMYADPAVTLQFGRDLAAFLSPSRGKGE